MEPELSKARFAPVLKVFGIGKLDFLQGYGSYSSIKLCTASHLVGKLVLACMAELSPAFSAHYLSMLIEYCPLLWAASIFITSIPWPYHSIRGTIFELGGPI
jgi:hypothetical protein